jgi:UV DNA damage endonuclease
MNKFHLGYCCINQTLRSKNIYTGRGMISKTFNIKESSKRALQNCRDLLTILQWNQQHHIKCFRIGSELFPRMTCSTHGYSFEQLPDYKEITSILDACGKFAHSNSMLLSMHPGPFTTLASPNPNARDNGIKELLMHSLICDLLTQSVSLDIPINFHIGGSYGGSYEETSRRFIGVVTGLSDKVRSRIVIENDDKKNGWSVKKLYEFIYKLTGIPITFDLHHHLFCSDGLSAEEAFLLCRSTWNGRSQQLHYSQSPTAEKLIPKHSDYYRDPLPSWLMSYDNFHVHLESKQKELSLIRLREEFKQFSDI